MVSHAITWPTVTVEINFSGSTWTDVTTYVIGDAMTIDRNGQRQDGRWQWQAGRLSLNLRNQDRRFDPSNTSGAYYPNIKPRKGIRVKAVLSAVTYWLFTGTIDSWDWQIDGRFSWVTVTASDGVKILSRNVLPTVAANPLEIDTPSGRITRILDAAGWSATARDVDADSTVYSVQHYVGGAAAWSMLQNVADSSLRELWIAPDGDLTSRSFLAMQNRGSPSGGTWRNTSGGTLLFHGIRTENDETQIYNRAVVSTDGGPQIIVEDPDSQTEYGVATFQRAGLVGDARDYQSVGGIGTSAADVAGWVIHLFSDLNLYFSSLMIEVADDSVGVLFPTVLTNDYTTGIQVRYTPPGGGSDLIRPCIIRGIHHEIGYRSWRTTWLLEDATRYEGAAGGGNAFILGTNVLNDNL